MNRLLAGLVLVAACNAAPPSNQTQSTNSTASETEKVNEAIARYRSSLNGGDSTSFFSLVSDSIELLPPGMASLRGGDARNLFRSLFTEVKPELGEFTNQEVVVAGDWAIQRYDFSLTTTPRTGGASTKESGSGLHVWHRDSDGAWRIRKDIWTSKPAS